MDRLERLTMSSLTIPAVIFCAGLLVIVLGDLWLTAAGLVRRLRLAETRAKILDGDAEIPEGEEMTVGLRLWLQILGLAVFALTVRHTLDQASALPVPDLVVALGYIVLLGALFAGPSRLVAAAGHRLVRPFARWVDGLGSLAGRSPQGVETTGRVVVTTGFVVSGCAVLPLMGFPFWIGLPFGLVFLQMRLREREPYLRRLATEEEIDARSRSPVREQD